MWCDAVFNKNFITNLPLSLRVHGNSVKIGQQSHGQENNDTFLANVNLRSRSLYAVARPSVVCLSFVDNARALYSGG